MPRHPPPPGYSVHVLFKGLGRDFEQNCTASGMTGKAGRDFVYALLEIVAQELAAGRDIAIPNIGNFKRVPRTRATYHDPRHGGSTPRVNDYGITFTPTKLIRNALGY